MHISIVPYQETYAREIADLFHASVHAIDPLIYTFEEQEAWAPTPSNYDTWAHKLLRTKPFVAMIDDKIVGFIELEEDGHIDCAYTHPDYQKYGIMSALYYHIENIAKQKGMDRLYVEASILIKPFFEKRGFAILSENKVVRNKTTLINYSMQKHLKSYLKRC